MVDLDELERLERQATPGPWDLWDLEERGAGYNILAERVIDFGGGLEAVHSLSLCRITEMDRDGKANLDLLLSLRNAAPALFAELRTLRARVDELERDARLGAVVREVAATGGVGSDAPDQLDWYAQSLADDHSMFGAAVIRAIADALRAEEGGEHG